MTKLRKSAIGIVSILSAGVFAASTVAYAFNVKGTGTDGAFASDIQLLNDAVNNNIEQYFDSNVVYRLPETVSDNDEVSVIISMSVDSVLDVYNKSYFRGTFQSFINTEAAKVASDKVERESESLIKTLKSAGIKYTLGEKYDTLLSGFEITIKASDFEKVNEMLEGENQLIVGETYYEAETQVVTNEVDVYETGIFDSSESEYQGDGVVVAVLDTGCDYTHTAFSADNFSPSQVALDLASVSAKVAQTTAASYTSGLTGSDVYVSRKIPFAYDYADKDSDVAPINSQHGTHVAGIIAGNDDQITGVAPNAQLAIMKVFSDARDGAKTSWILAALEDCVTLGVDVINMSLGTSCGFSREIDDERRNAIYDSIKDAGISLIAAASNDHNSTFGSEKNGNLGLTSNPDSGTVGSPSTYGASLSVASVDGVKTPYLKYGDDIIYYTEATTSSVKKKNFVEDILKTVGDVDSFDFEYVTIPGVGRSSDYLESNEFYHNKIVLVKRGITMFEDKVRVALIDKGAAGIIIYNNVSGAISMSVGKDMGAVCSITQDEGEKLAAAETGILHISRDQKAGPFMSDFSSWGPTSDLKIKPEITAHGGEIYSAVPGQRYDRLSGTSMAAPNQAGATALIRQYVKFGTNANGTKIFGDLSTTEVTARVNQLMMSTADIVYNKNGLPYAVRKQGAGLMNIMSAATTASYITTYERDEDGVYQPMDKSKLELGDDKNKSGVYEMTFGVTNVSGSSVSYDVNAIVMTEGVSATYTSHGDTTVTQDGYILDGAAFEVTSVSGGSHSGSLVTVTAGGTAMISVKITLSDSDKEYLDKSFAYGMYVEGFITLKASSGTSVNMSVPMLGFYGDWTQAPIFDEEYYDTNKDEINSGLDAEDKLMADAYATRVIGGLYTDYIATLGTYYFKQDPSATQIAADKNKIAISNQEGTTYATVNKIRSISAGLLRNCREIDISIVEDATGREVVPTIKQYNQYKSYSHGGSIYASSIDVEFSALANKLKNNTKYTVTVSAYIDYGENSEQKNKRNTFTFPLYIDFEAPIVTDVVYRTEYDRTTKQTKLFADLSVYDNHYAMGLSFGQAVLAENPDFVNGPIFSLNSFGKYITPIYSSFNSTSIVTLELTDYIADIKNSYGLKFNADGTREIVEHTNSFIVSCYDYAMNSATYEISLPDEIAAMYFEQNGEQTNEITLSLNETLDLTTVLKIYPEESWVQTLDFTTDNNKVADIINQTVVAKQFGEATITASGYDASGNKITASVKIIVEGDKGYTIPQVNKFSLVSYKTNKAYYSVSSDEREIGLTGYVNDFGGIYSLSMFPSESVTINYTLDSYFPDKTTVEYSVGNSRVATVSEDGTIIAQAEGTTIVTASVRFDGNSTLYSERISITVKDPFTTNSIYLMSYKGLGGTVEIPADRGITTIYSYAFSNYEYIDKDTDAGDIIDDEDPLYIKQWYIGEDTIKKVIIPDGVEEINAYAFAKLTALEEVVMPASLTKIGVGAFYGCEKLKTINLENVQFINSEAFRGCALERMNLDTVVAIGNYTFAENSLTSLILPSTAQSLGEGAFKNNTNLASVQFRAPKIKIAPYVFYGCTELRSININSAVISSYAFAGCTKLQNVTLGRDVAVIGEFAFAGTSVAKFTIASGNTVFRTDNNGANIYEGEKLILRAPAADANNRFITIEATEIASGAFAGNSNIVMVSAPNATKIGSYAFANCFLLVQINMPNLVEIGDYAFYRTGITETPDLSNVKTIGNYAFSRTQVASVDIPDGATVGEGAFYWCSKIESVTIGDDVKIGLGAFANYVGTDYAYEFYKNTAVFKRFYSTYTYEVEGNAEKQESLTFYRFDIEAAVNYNSLTGVTEGTALTSVTIGNNVLLGNRAFAGNIKLDSLSLGDGAKIGDYAFYNAVALSSVELSGALSVGAYAFSGMVAYDYYIYSRNGTNYVTRAMNFYYEGDELKATQYLSSYFAPQIESVDLTDVTTLGVGAFAYSQKLSNVTLGNLEMIAPMAFAVTSIESITLPASVTVIGQYAFYGNYINTVDLSNVDTIGAYAFYANELTSVVLKAGAMIGDYALAYNLDLATVTNLDKAIYIGDYAFYGVALEKLTLTDAQYIGDFAFALSAVEQVTFGEALVELGENPFYGCDISTFAKMESVEFNGKVIGERVQETYDISKTVKVIGGVLYQTVPTGLELVSYPASRADAAYTIEEGTVRISARAFALSPIKNVTIASTVKSIGDKAFYGCGKLSTVIFLSYYAPILEEEYNASYAGSGSNFPIPGYYYGYEGLGISKYYMWSLSSNNNYYYGANFVDYIGHISDNIVMVRPANGQNYDTFIMSQYFGSTINGAYAATDDTLYVIALIDKIPANITLADEPVVVAARTAYDKIPSLDQRSLVTNYSKLTSAEQTIEYLKSRLPGTDPEPESEGTKGGNNFVTYFGYILAGVAVIALVAYIVVTQLLKRKAATVTDGGETVAEGETAAEDDTAATVSDEGGEAGAEGETAVEGDTAQADTEEMNDTPDEIE